MRIKKDKSNYRASGIIHRDNRHDKSVDGSTGPVAKKNTKKWCRGNEGHFHKLEWKESKQTRTIRGRYPNVGIKMDIVCSQCYKVLKRDKDAWATKWIEAPPKKKQELMEQALAKYCAPSG